MCEEKRGRKAEKIEGGGWRMENGEDEDDGRVEDWQGKSERRVRMDRVRVDGGWRMERMKMRERLKIGRARVRGGLRMDRTRLRERLRMDRVRVKGRVMMDRMGGGSRDGNNTGERRLEYGGWKE
jgi:hypothetical protein